MRLILISLPMFCHRSKHFGQKKVSQHLRSGSSSLPAGFVICHLARSNPRRQRANTFKTLSETGMRACLNTRYGALRWLVSRAPSRISLYGIAFSQLSQQYHDESEARFVRPHGIDQVPEAASAWDHAMRDGRAAYRKILDALEQTNRFVPPAERREARRALRSAARSVLPNATETAIVVTANARALRHFFMVRGGIVGDAEMRYVGAALLDLVGPEAPAVFADFSIEFPGDGLPLLVHHPMK